MRDKIRMVGLDLDGTLLNGEKKLTSYTRKILDRAIAKGTEIVIVTGRNWEEVPEDIKNFSGIHYMITANGARITEVETNKILGEHLLSYKKAKKALEMVQKYQSIQDLYYKGEGYVSEKQYWEIEEYYQDPKICQYLRATRKRVPDLIAFLEEKRCELDKVEILFKRKEEKEQAWHELKTIKGIRLLSLPQFNNIEVNDMETNKGKALLELGMILGIQPTQIMACGDSDNDVEMIRMAGLSVAMENAVKEVKAASDYVTDSNEEEGAAKAIEKFVL